VFDNLSLADSASWKLLKIIFENCEHLLIISCLDSAEEHIVNDQNRASENYKISEHATKFYKE